VKKVGGAPEDEVQAPYRRPEFELPVDDEEGSHVPEGAFKPTKNDPLLDMLGPAEARRRAKAKKALAFKRTSSAGKKVKP
jgi:hypothetical protein